ncbi:MAG: Celeribacter phage [Bacteroidota bacterium]|jgi:hypothetical protein
MIKLVTNQMVDCIQMVDSIPDNFTGIARFENGIIGYYKNSLFHREDGPAYITRSGYKTWWFEGKLHNLNGPAKIWPRGREEYWIDNKYFSKENWEREVARIKNPCKDVFVEV